jgi:hypothetical protein
VAADGSGTHTDLSDAVDAANLDPVKPVTVLVRAGSYTDDVTLGDDVHLRADIEALAYAVTLNGTVSFAGATFDDRSTISGLYIQSPTSPVIAVSQGKLEIHNSSIHRSDSASTGPVAEVTGGRLTLFDSSVTTADTDAIAVVSVAGGTFWSYRSDVSASSEANRSLLVTSGQGSVFGPAAISGYVEYTGPGSGGALTLADLRVSGAANGLVASAAPGAVVVAQSGFRGMTGAAINNLSAVVHALVTVSGANPTFAIPVNQVALDVELPAIRYDNSVSGLAAATLKGAVDELAADRPQRGKQVIAVAALAAGAEDTSVSVVFPNPFPAATIPVVSVSIESADGNDLNDALVSIRAVSETGFTLRLNNPSAVGLAGLSGTLHWVAQAP